MNRRELENVLEKTASEITEHFDVVQIMASRVEDDGNTTTIFMGKGNWHARVGMAQEFDEVQKARVFQHVAREEMHDEDEDEGGEEQAEETT